MSIDDRLIECFKEVALQGISPEDFNTPFVDFGLDSLDVLDLVYGVEKAFDVRNLASGRLIRTESFSLADVKTQLLSILPESQLKKG